MKIEELVDRAVKEGVINVEGKLFHVRATHVKFINKFGRKVDYYKFVPIEDDNTLFKHDFRSYEHKNGWAPWWLASEIDEYNKSYWGKLNRKEKVSA